MTASPQSGGVVLHDSAMVVVTTLRVAPVKGLATVAAERIEIDEHGVAEDRRLFVLDQHGAVVTLRTHPKLVQVIPDLDLGRGVLNVTLPDGTRASSRLDQVGTEVRSHLFGKVRAGRIIPGDVAEALSTVAGQRLRLVLADRVGVGWDEGPVSLLGRASAAAVGGPDPDMARYRMLVEVSGTEAYEEETWVGRQLELGTARVGVTHPLGRCVVITTSPTTGNRDWNGLRALADTRGPDQLRLGVIAEVVRPGHVRVGSQVRVLDCT